LFSSFSRPFLSASAATALPVELHILGLTGANAIERPVTANWHYMELRLVKDSKEESLLSPRYASATILQSRIELKMHSCFKTA